MKGENEAKMRGEKGIKEVRQKDEKRQNNKKKTEWHKDKIRGKTK